MKTLLTTSNAQVLKPTRLLFTLLVAFFMFQVGSAQVSTQQLSVKGTISDDRGPIEGTAIALKGTKIGTVTDAKGAFTFPQAVTVNDVLLISCLGYKTLEIKVDGKTDTFNIVLTEDLIEFTGAPNTNTPYKAKRAK
ncbi:MAG TPA: carboxypeptidase-like regulatory domain-containing protein [Flavobacteriaceae bacterium]|nr:carboxypeptidase-like regulatory domain-containing protein [Flavobacteriaceae bacterium]